MRGSTRDRWLRAEILTLTFFHVALGAAIALGPVDVVVTPSSVEAFRVMPDALTLTQVRACWGLAFILCGALIALLAWRRSPRCQYLTVVAAAFTDGLWAFALGLPLLDGSGSLPFAIIFPALLAWTGFVIVRVAHWSGG